MALSGKVSIITGASSGLGLATAIMFAQKGAMITLCGRDQERLQAAQEQCIQASGGHTDRFITVLGDLNDTKVREDTVAKTLHKFGCLDILVANAGVILPESGIKDATEETFNTLFNTNVKSVFFLIQQALPHLEKSKGNIVSVSSCVSTLATSPNFIYGMTKATLDHMTRCLALDLGPKGIRVNAVQPSLVPSRIWRDFPGELSDVQQKLEESAIGKQPMGRFATADDVAEAISFLASDAAKFITGECMPVDCGRFLTGAKWQYPVTN